MVIIQCALFLLRVPLGRPLLGSSRRPTTCNSSRDLWTLWIETAQRLPVSKTTIRDFWTLYGSRQRNDCLFQRQRFVTCGLSVDRDITKTVCFKGNDGKTFERRGAALTSFSERTDTILNSLFFFSFLRTACSSGGDRAVNRLDSRGREFKSRRGQ